MTKFIKDFIKIINDCNYDNTYKMAWAKSLVEIACEATPNSDIYTITFEQIARKYLKYYFNQTIYFDLIQGSNIKRIPEVVQVTKKFIEQYFNAKNNNNPIKFERIEDILPKLNLTEEYNFAIIKITKTLKKDVSHRFMNLGKEKINIYNLNIKDNELFINTGYLKDLKENSNMLFQIVNYRWTQMLETFNTSPRIALKVRATHELDGVKRKPLKPFHKYLNLMSEKPICFFCGKQIGEKEISVDHIIPWSFMYSDDIWNLVYCHKSENSSKSNIIPDENIIKQLEQRNIELLSKFKDNSINNKLYDELNLAIEHNYVRKFWLSAKG